MSETPTFRPSDHPIHIGIDGNEANVNNRVGSNRYAFEMLKSLSNLTVKGKFTIYLSSPPIADMPKTSPNWHYRVIPPSKFWTQWRLPLELYTSNNRPDVFYSPSHYLPRFCPTPSVNTIFDLAYLKFPKLFLSGKRGVMQLKAWTEYSIKKASRIITISQSTKNDLQDIYHLNDAQIDIAYPGYDQNHFVTKSTNSVNKIKDHYQINSPYLLYVGTLQPRKNLIRLIKAFEQLPANLFNYQLVLAGSKGWLNEELDHLLQTSSAKNRIRLTGFVPDKDLPSLYAGASLTLLVGLYEGFGIPPLESIASGTLPLVSNTSSLPEVVGDCGYIVDPYSIGSIKEGIIRALNETTPKRAKRLACLKEHIKKFDWTLSANKIYKVLYDVAFFR